MDDGLYQGALRQRDQDRKRLDDLRAEQRVVETRLQVIEDFIRGYEKAREVAQAPPMATQEAAVSAEVENSKSSRRRSQTPPRQLAALAREELLARKRPMTRGELVDALESRGVEFDAKDKAKNLGTILWRMSDQFENIPGQGYWLRGVPLSGHLI